MKLSATLGLLRCWAMAGAASAITVSSLDAHACGVSSAGVATCTMPDRSEAEPLHWAVGASGVYTSTALNFTGGVRAEQTRYAALASIAYLPTPSLVLQAGAGAAFAGSLTLPDGRHLFSPGPAALLGVAWRAYESPHLSLLLTSILSYSSARTHLGTEDSVSYQAFDVRLGAEVGTTLFDILKPYIALRAFGGPVLWHYQGLPVTGTDVHHYQIGGGLGVRISRRISLFAEGIPLGEQAVSLGLAVAF